MLFKVARKLFRVAFIVANPLIYCNGKKERAFDSAKEELRKVKELTRRHRRFFGRFRPSRCRNSRRSSDSSYNSNDSNNRSSSSNNRINISNSRRISNSSIRSLHQRPSMNGSCSIKSNNELPPVKTKLSNNTENISKNDIGNPVIITPILSAEAKARRMAYIDKTVLIAQKAAEREELETKKVKNTSEAPISKEVIVAVPAEKYNPSLSDVEASLKTQGVQCSSTPSSSLITESSATENTTGASSLTTASSVEENKRVPDSSDTELDKEIVDVDSIEKSNEILAVTSVEIKDEDSTTVQKEVTVTTTPTITTTIPAITTVTPTITVITPIITTTNPTINTTIPTITNTNPTIHAITTTNPTITTTIPKTQKEDITSGTQKEGNEKTPQKGTDGLGHQKGNITEATLGEVTGTKFQEMNVVLSPKKDLCAFCKEAYADISSCSDKVLKAPSSSKALEECNEVLEAEETQRKIDQEKEFLQKQEEFLVQQQKVLENQKEQNQKFTDLFMEEARETSNFRGIVLHISKDKQQYEEETNRAYTICGSMACFAALLATQTLMKC